MRKMVLFLGAVSMCATLAGCGANKNTGGEVTVEITAVETQVEYATAETNGEAVSVPDKITLYSKMRFTTSVAATSDSPSYAFAEEVDGENNYYGYIYKKNYGELRQYFCNDGAFTYLSLGDVSCVFRAPNPNLSITSTIVSDINAYVNAISNAEYIGSNVDYWIYQTNANSDDPYKVYIRKGESTPEYITKLSSKIVSIAKEVSKTETTGIGEITYTVDNGAFPECTNVTNAQMEMILKRFYADMDEMDTAEKISQFTDKLMVEKKTLKEYYLSVVSD